MNKKLVLGYPRTLGTGSQDSYPFEAMFDSVLVSPASLDLVDALIVWGGEDISPVMYGEKPSITAHTSRLTEPGYRDRIEAELVENAFEQGIPVIGICRGAQLVCAMSGGKLVQHVDHHGGDHQIVTNDGRTLITSSVHHQMMWPFGMSKEQYQMLAWTKKNRSQIYVFNDHDIRQEVDEVEPEVLWFPETKALAIQGHPEFMDEDAPFVRYCRELINQYIVKDVQHA